MTCWRRRIESISGAAEADILGNSARANRSEYDGAFISTQLNRLAAEQISRPPLTLILAGPEVDNQAVPFWFPE
jgi:hypothetical protein